MNVRVEMFKFKLQFVLQLLLVTKVRHYHETQQYNELRESQANLST